MKKIVCVDKRKYVFWGRKKGRHNQKRKYIWPLHRALRKKEILGVATEICNTVEIKCPENYSFVENTEEFIMHLNNAKERAKNWKIVDFNLRNIKQLSFDALCLLMAETRNKNVFGKVKWSIPKDKALRIFFERSGFIRRFKSERDYYCEWEMFNYVSDKSLSPDLSKHIISIVQKYVFGGDKTKMQQTKLHPFFVEAMKNTDDHAWDGYNWWVFYYKWDDKTVKICFLDLWAGILKTLSKTMLEYTLFGTSESDRLQGLFEGKLQSAKRRTKTEEEKRWTGLPLIYWFLQGKYIQNGYAISNKVKFDLNNQQYSRLENSSFNGTLYYFEIKDS